MEQSPLISIVMPVYNVERYVREAIMSIEQQTYLRREIICVNDGSTDGSRAILDSFGDSIVLVDSGVNEGIAAARNRGIAAAHGEYIALMDADDIALPKRLMAQYEYLREHPEVDVVFGRIECFLSPDLDLETRAKRYCPPGVMEGYISPTALMRRSVFDRVGLFDPKWRVGEFIDWFDRARQKGVICASVPEVVLRRRIHATNTGVRQRNDRVDYLRIVRAALERRRSKTVD